MMIMGFKGGGIKMSKERLEEIKKSYNFWAKEDESIGLLPDDIEWLIGQAERAEYYEAQNEQKIHAFEEIIDLLNEDYFENWEQAIEVAHEYKNDFVRAEKISSDLRIRATKESLKEQNKRYREALELLVKQETIGNDVKTGKTAISYNGMIALKGLGVFNDDNYIVYGLDEIIESVLEESE